MLYEGVLCSFAWKVGIWLAGALLFYVCCYEMSCLKEINLPDFLGKMYKIHWIVEIILTDGCSEVFFHELMNGMLFC